MAWLLCSKEDVMSLHPISESSLKDSWSEMVEGLIREHMGALYLGESVAITDEYHNGDGTDILTVNKPSIVSIQSLEVDGAALTASDYIVFKNYVQLKNLTFSEDRLNVKISYTSGGTSVPQHVRFAATTMIIAIINYRGRYGADSGIRFANTEPREGESSPNVNVGLVTHLRAIMKGLLHREKVRVR